MAWANDYAISQDSKQYQDDIYRELFPIRNIIRFEREDSNILDRKFHIDVCLELENNTRLLGQEKALRNKFSNFDTFTIEFYQNRFTKEKGEFFHIAAQFYLHGYRDGDGIEDTTKIKKWYFIKLFDFIEWLKDKPLEELEKQTRPSTSNASFFYIKYNDIPTEFIYRSHKRESVSSIMTRAKESKI
jgi:hypothetical protein